MTTTRDIRSFFGPQPPAKKRRTQPPAAGGADAGQAGDAAADGTKNTTDDAEPPHQEGEKEDECDADVVVSSYVALQSSAQLRSLMHRSWFDVLEKEFSRGSFRSLSRFLAAEEARKMTIYPPPSDVFAALRDCAFSELKVVILGQDPYHGPQQAHGLSFSVRHGVPPPPSLKNIFKEAMSDVGIARPSHGCLSDWSRQGVLLLNTVLTVRRGEANSHKKRGWEQFTDAVIAKINAKASNVVFLLWDDPHRRKAP
ncbi:hypothetical protein BBJ28_00004789 [Nothophytophthora sp. Chile5]|nr:hypothetical protein BBJ28_00004789 [Nothophytophthora sp. Chile5]